MTSSLISGTPATDECTRNLGADSSATIQGTRGGALTGLAPPSYLSKPVNVDTRVVGRDIELAVGETRPADLNSPAGNYAKLAARPIWFTFYPGLQPSPMPNDITTLNQRFLQRTHHQHAVPIYWRSSEHGPMLFCWGENGNLRGWNVGANGVATYLACSAEVASAQSPVPPGGMPGAMMCLSANGAVPNTAVVWACIPYLDANMVVSPGRLLAYDATSFGTFGDGNKQLRVLWDSQDWNLGFSFCKFTPPVVLPITFFFRT
jgi:hypothetical protein